MHIVETHFVFFCLLGGILLTLAVFDFYRMILPNWLNLSLAAAGATQSVRIGQPSVIDAALGAFAGGGSLLLVAALFRRLRGIDGLGRGDLKLAAAAGIWTGWQGIPLMLLVASVSALVFFVGRAVWNGSLDRGAPLPFGPFLGLGTFLAWLVNAA
jgi:prepilin signal peptidase PulO-like enzyme (type II secretory pathway)